jgi:hypothetical protein
MKKQWFVVRTKQIFTNHSYLSAVMLSPFVWWCFAPALASPVVPTQVDTEGKMTALRIQVSKDGFKPPQ